MTGAQVTVTVGIDHQAILLLARDQHGRGAAILLEPDAAMTLADELTVHAERWKQAA